VERKEAELFRPAPVFHLQPSYIIYQQPHRILQEIFERTEDGSKLVHRRSIFTLDRSNSTGKPFQTLFCRVSASGTSTRYQNKSTYQVHPQIPNMDSPNLESAGGAKRKRSPVEEGVTRPPPLHPGNAGNSGNVTQINYLMKAKSEKLRLIEGDKETFGDVLGMIDDYEGMYLFYIIRLLFLVPPYTKDLVYALVSSRLVHMQSIFLFLQYLEQI
jgi:hypothetical protein